MAINIVQYTIKYRIKIARSSKIILLGRAEVYTRINLQNLNVIHLGKSCIEHCKILVKMQVTICCHATIQTGLQR